MTTPIRSRPVRRVTSMMWMVWIAMSLACATQAVAAQAPSRFVDPQLRRWSPTPAVLARYDADHDGVLNATEKAAYRRDILQKVEPIRKAALRDYDWNKNGVLDPGERTARQQARQEMHARAEARALTKYDANGNGVLDAPEQAKRKADRDEWLLRMKTRTLEAYDANKNGMLDPDEKATIRRRAEEGRQLALDRYDVNQDGHIDAAERAEAVLRGRQANPRAGSVPEGRAVTIAAAAGGVAVAEGGAARLSIPARALAGDGNVTLVASGETPAAGGRIQRTIEVAWEGGALQKPATLEIEGGSAITPTGKRLVIGRWTDGSWQTLPSQLVTPGKRAMAAITEPGRYALLQTSATPVIGLANVSVTPAVGSRYTQGAVIAFTLGSPGGASVRVYDMAGRLVRSVASSNVLAEGEHVVRWEGTGMDGRQVSNGLYMISVQALGQRVTKKIAVVR